MRYFLWGSLALMLMACQPTSENHTADNHSTEHAAADSASTASQTQVVTVDGFQVSFDITTMAAHHELMASMNMEMGDDHKAKMAADGPSHYVMVTVLDDQKKPVANAPLKLKVIDPAGKPVGDAAGIDAETMSGKGMFHYGHGFDLSAPGRYQVMAMFAVEGTTHQTGIYWEATP